MTPNGSYLPMRVQLTDTPHYINNKMSSLTYNPSYTPMCISSSSYPQNSISSSLMTIFFRKCPLVVLTFRVLELDTTTASIRLVTLPVVDGAVPVPVPVLMPRVPHPLVAPPGSSLPFTLCTIARDDAPPFLSPSPSLARSCSASASSPSSSSSSLALFLFPFLGGTSTPANVSCGFKRGHGVRRGLLILWSCSYRIA